jgi:hypothetical protein
MFHTSRQVRASRSSRWATASTSTWASQNTSMVARRLAEYLASVDVDRLRQGGDERGDQDLAIDRPRDVGPAFYPARAHTASVSAAEETREKREFRGLSRRNRLAALAHYRRVATYYATALQRMSRPVTASAIVRSVAASASAGSAPSTWRAPAIPTRTPPCRRISSAPRRAAGGTAAAGVINGGDGATSQVRVQGGASVARGVSRGGRRGRRRRLAPGDRSHAAQCQLARWARSSGMTRQAPCGRSASWSTVTRRKDVTRVG